MGSRTLPILLLGLALTLAAGAATEAKACKADGDCGAGQFCEFRAGTCGERGAGRCTEKPEVCTQEFDPVCGCDNRTYSNDCLRRSDGVSLKSEGECPLLP